MDESPGAHLPRIFVDFNRSWAPGEVRLSPLLVQEFGVTETDLHIGLRCTLYDLDTEVEGVVVSKDEYGFAARYDPRDGRDLTFEINPDLWRGTE